ncbi:MAG: nucleotide pyrophosphohydrolase [Thermotogota bacterium]
MKDIIEQLVKFRDERNWKQFHTPEHLAKSVVLEAAELLENYQWEKNPDNLEDIKDEIADVMSYCLLLSEHYGFDVKEIIKEGKNAKNEKKYRKVKAYGKSDKYTDL